MRSHNIILKNRDRKMLNKESEKCKRRNSEKLNIYGRQLNRIRNINGFE